MYKIRIIIVLFLITVPIFSLQFMGKSINTNSNEDKEINKNIISRNPKEEVSNNKINDDNNDILLTIEIEKIKLKGSVYSIYNSNNNVDKNITIMKQSQLPIIKNGNLILAAHSGSGPLAYFNRLIELKEEDEITITYDDLKYVYKVSHIYDDNKDNKIIIRRNENKTTLTLFTCKNNDKNNYLVIVAYLIDNYVK